jgi:hypothetical protein
MESKFAEKSMNGIEDDGTGAPARVTVVRRQEREWLLQRIAWWLLLTLLAAIGMGLFGRGGPLSELRLGSRDGALLIELDRFIRYHSPDTLTVTVRTSLEKTPIRLDARYLRQIQIEHVTPQPAREIGGGAAVTYVFDTRPGERLTATFHFSADKYGRLAGWVESADGNRVDFSQFAYP